MKSVHQLEDCRETGSTLNDITGQLSFFAHGPRLSQGIGRPIVFLNF